MKKITHLIFSRRFVTILLIILQAIALLISIELFSVDFTSVYIFTNVLSIIMVIYLINRETSPSLKIPWLVLMTMVPVFGGIIYLLFGQNHISQFYKKEYELLLNLKISSMGSDEKEYLALEKEAPEYLGQANYIREYCHTRLYANTKTTYLPQGEIMFEKMCEALRGAKKFIFIESFIVAKGKMLDDILEILVEKVNEGVDVRFIYDDIGCLTTLPSDFDRYLRSLGIKTYVFNRLIPALSIVHNNRDHRKITVIDGEVGFTGGINIADEYINEKVRFGHWKDSAIMLEGKGVDGLTLIFLKTWNHHQKEDKEYYKFLNQQSLLSYPGHVLCYEDSPLDQELMGENVYLNIINQAHRYLYITTPYLIIDHELKLALCNAAKRGVDVRLITPHIPDKWYVHLISQSNYHSLIEAGVKIYEYTPGFIHAKTFVCDDKVATVGTINLDYRSLVHHFECGTLLINTTATEEIREDFIKTQQISQQIELGYFESKPVHVQLLALLLKLFSPLM